MFHIFNTNWLLLNFFSKKLWGAGQSPAYIKFLLLTPFKINPLYKIKIFKLMHDIIITIIKKRIAQMYINDKLMKAIRTGETAQFFTDSKQKESVEVEELGMLNLPTGKIIANDPLTAYQDQSFIDSVKPGSYPVYIYVHNIDDDKRVSLAEIRFTDATPVRFETALAEGETLEDLNTLGEDEFFGYGVDSGTGGFMDVATYKMLEALEDGFEDLNDELDQSYVHTYSTANATFPNTDNNIVAFSSGFGDGAYPSFWGFDEAGNRCCLITDFITIQEEENDEDE